MFKISILVTVGLSLVSLVSFLWETQQIRPIRDVLREYGHYNDASSVIYEAPASNLAVRDNKPYLIMHVGPPKTATTTIQSVLTDLQDELLRDNYVYMGAFDSKGGPYIVPPKAFLLMRDFQCNKAMHAARVGLNDTALIKETLKSVECAQDLLKELGPYRQKQQSIIWSDESLSAHFWPQWEGIGRAPLDWISLRELLQEDWNLRIVIAYRRYVDWLPSARQQVDRWTEAKPALNNWPGKPRVRPLPPLFPNYWKSLREGQGLMPYFHTFQLLEGTKGHIPEVQVLNLHTGGTTRTKFLCDMLVNASHACEWSREMDSKGKETRVNEAETLYYDMLTLEAERQGLIQTDKISRHDVNLMAQLYHERGLYETFQDFPVVCPTRETMEPFLRRSLQYEEKCLPDFHSSELGEAMHRANFWNKFEKKSYCSIDVATVLSDKLWRDFYSRLPVIDRVFYKRERSAIKALVHGRVTKEKNHREH